MQSNHMQKSQLLHYTIKALEINGMLLRSIVHVKLQLINTALGKLEHACNKHLLYRYRYHQNAVLNVHSISKGCLLRNG